MVHSLFCLPPLHSSLLSPTDLPAIPYIPQMNDYPTFASTWMGLEEIMLSEISQAEKDNYHMVSLIYGT